MTVRAPAVHAAVVRPDRGGREERDQRQALGGAQLDLAAAARAPRRRGRAPRRGRRGRAPRRSSAGSSGPPSWPHVATKPMIASIGSGQNHFEMNAGDGCRARRRTPRSPGSPELDPHADPREHLADVSATRRTVASFTTTVSSSSRTPSAPGSKPAVVQQLRGLARVEAAEPRPRARTTASARGSASGPASRAPQVLVDQRLPVDRERDRAADADVGPEPGRLVVEPQVDERRLLELDHSMSGFAARRSTSSSDGVLEAVDLARARAPRRARGRRGSGPSGRRRGTAAPRFSLPGRARAR